MDFFFKFLANLKGSHIHFSTTFVGTRGISVAKGCRIKPYAYLKSKLGSRLVLEENVVIERYSHISSKGKILQIGRNSYIGYNNWIGGQGDITIDENFMSGMNVVIISSNHNYYQIETPYIAGPEIPGRIHIGKNVWIGANVVVLPNVTIGEGSVIAAGSIVFSAVPENVVVSGNPAKIIKTIKR